jgi:adenosylcobinamide-phosphate synthase
MATWITLIALLFAFALDRWFGEPPVRWHPVAWMGKYLAWMGGQIAPRMVLPSPNWLAFSAGALAWYGGAAVAVMLAWLLQFTLMGLEPLVAGLLLGILLKPMVSWRFARVEAAQVEEALAGSLDAGRRQLGRLVSHEVMHLDEAEVRECAIESLAHNLHRSVVAPVFWFLIAGLPGAVLYRFANAADAMWGYRGFHAGADWEWAGKWAARADDVLSWLPARLTALLLGLTAGRLSWRELRHEAGRARSPNSGWPVAAMALALGLRLSQPGNGVFNARGEPPTEQDTGWALNLSGRAVTVLLAWSGVTIFLLAGEWPW